MSHLLPGSLTALSDTTIGALTTNEILTWNGTAWVNQAAAGATSFTITGEGANAFTIVDSDTLNFATPDSAFEFDTSTADTVSFNWSTAPATGGTNQTVLVWDDNTDSYSWDSPIKIAAGSSTYLSFDNATRELSVSNLLITDVTVNAVVADITAYVATTPTHQEGDVIILTAATGGSQTWIHNGGVAGTIADYTQILDGSHMTSFSVAGDAGAAQSIAEGNTMTISGGAGLTTTASATDTITVDFSVQPTTGGATNQALVFSDTGDTYAWQDITTFESITATNGLTRTADDIELGGTLTSNTTVAGSTFSLDLTTTTGGINLTSTGAGAITLDAPTGNVVLGSATTLQFNNAANTFNTTFTAGVNTVDIDYTLPIVAPTAGQVLSSDASGVLSWATGATDNIYTADGALAGARAVTMAANNLTFNSTTGNFQVVGTSTSFINLQTVGGGISLQETVGGISLSTTTGNIDVTTDTGDFAVISTGASQHTIQSVGGAISLEETTGTISITTTTGDVTVGPSSTGILAHKGTQNYPVSVKTASYTIVEGDHVIVADGNAAVVTITTPTTPNVGDIYYIKAIDLTNAVSVTTPAAHKIDGADTHTFSIANESITICYSATNAWVIL